MLIPEIDEKKMKHYHLKKMSSLAPFIPQIKIDLKSPVLKPE
jgi:hypothetical protein